VAALEPLRNAQKGPRRNETRFPMGDFFGGTGCLVGSCRDSGIRKSQQLLG